MPVRKKRTLLAFLTRAIREQASTRDQFKRSREVNSFYFRPSVSKRLINFPDSFENWESAVNHLEACCELMGKKPIDPSLPFKARIYLYCRLLEINPEQVFEAIRRGNG